jgi:uncharacterized protein (DUF1330 family)
MTETVFEINETCNIFETNKTELLIMGCYVLAQLKFRDLPAYRRYQAQFFEVMRPFKGRLLVADEGPRVLEGSWQQDKVVLIWFPDEGAFREWEGSDAYQRIARDRQAGAETVSLLLRGRADCPDVSTERPR